jgi:hypothetical protein
MRGYKELVEVQQARIEALELLAKATAEGRTSIMLPQEHSPQIQPYYVAPEIMTLQEYAKQLLEVDDE